MGRLMTIMIIFTKDHTMQCCTKTQQHKYVFDSIELMWVEIHNKIMGEFFIGIQLNCNTFVTALAN
jgi:hypothetical protein